MRYQAHHAHISQARLLEQLREYGLDISAGQVNEMLLRDHDAFHAEKGAWLPTAREVSGVLHTDGTSARHGGQNAVGTHLGNERFASFHTDSTSRLNFLQRLCQPEERDTLNEEKTCRKLGVSCGQFLHDRLIGAATIPPLPDLIRQAATQLHCNGWFGFRAAPLLVRESRGRPRAS